MRVGCLNTSHWCCGSNKPTVLCSPTIQGYKTPAGKSLIKRCSLTMSLHNHGEVHGYSCCFDFAPEAPVKLSSAAAIEYFGDTAKSIKYLDKTFSTSAYHSTACCRNLLPTGLPRQRYCCFASTCISGFNILCCLVSSCIRAESQRKTTVSHSSFYS